MCTYAHMHKCATAVGNGTYTYYVRKHNGLIVFDSVANVTDRALRIRNCECLVFRVCVSSPIGGLTQISIVCTS